MNLVSIGEFSHQDEVEPLTRELFLHRLCRGGVPRVGPYVEFALSLS